MLERGDMTIEAKAEVMNIEDERRSHWLSSCRSWR
jgi:hypothetical protein